MEKSNTKTIKTLNTLLDQGGWCLFIYPINSECLWGIYCVPGSAIDNRAVVVSK